MLFGYPIEATAENWLHDSVIAAVEKIHEFVEDGKNMPVWPDILPVAYRDKLENRPALQERLSSYDAALRNLTVAERKQTLDTLGAQNRITELLNCQCNCQAVAQLPLAIREPILSLFTFVFGLLTAYEVRQRQYVALYNSIPAKICPFCGCEGLEAPSQPQEDFDHYLPRSKYPFAAANLRNLAPMGGKCNATYKRTQDPLHHTNGQRRLAFDPYSSISIGISLDGSVVDEAAAGPIVTKWMIDFYPDNEAVETWDEIFHVRERWTNNLLRTHAFSHWLESFRNFCRLANLNIADDESVMEAIKRYAELQTGIGFDDKAFLKAAFFNFLHRRCIDGSPRLLPILRDVAGAPQPAV